MDGEINDLSIANLTKVADLKRTSTYKFFPHPDDIKIALIERYINELKEKLENFNVSSSEHHQTLKELINEIYLYFKENISAQKIILANTVNPMMKELLLSGMFFSLGGNTNNKMSKLCIKIFTKSTRASCMELIFSPWVAIMINNDSNLLIVLNFRPFQIC